MKALSRSTPVPTKQGAILRVSIGKAKMDMAASGQGKSANKVQREADLASVIVSNIAADAAAAAEVPAAGAADAQLTADAADAAEVHSGGRGA